MGMVNCMHMQLIDFYINVKIVFLIAFLNESTVIFDGYCNLVDLSTVPSRLR